MDEKISNIKSKLEKDFPITEISYELLFDVQTHRFRINI